MTILDVATKVALKVGVAVPSQLFASTEREHVELRNLLNEAAGDIADMHDWQLLKTIETITGDGSNTAFALPSDYDRMLRTASVWSSRYLWAMDHILDTDQWLELLVLPYTQVNGTWTIYGGQFHILDTMASGDTAKFFYISNLIVSPASGSNKATFTADDDSFRLSEKLLELLTVVKWNSVKGQVSDDDIEDFDDELKRLIDKDGGSKPVVSGRPYTSWRGRNIAWPGSVSGTP
ncbi:MAG: hypothetical protein RLW68_00815 [Devosia marina]|uniref:phage adaptor protein n=1 Tax=Devosia marina TaxID=2683198 RepID=UPI0032EB9BA2